MLLIYRYFAVPLLAWMAAARLARPSNGAWAHIGMPVSARSEAKPVPTSRMSGILDSLDSDA